MKDYLGQVWWPVWNVNAIGNMIPGQGYQVKMDVAHSYTYPPNSLTPALKYVVVPPVRNYSGVMNTGNNHTLGIPLSAWFDMPEVGDEIGVFYNGTLAGSGVFTGEMMAIPVWGDDFTTSAQEGVSNDGLIEIRLWNRNTNYEMILETESWIEGTDHFEKDGISVVGKFKAPEWIFDQFKLNQNMPNPASEMTTIGFVLPEKAMTQLTVFNALGQEVEQLVLGELEKGEYEFRLDVNKYKTGNYFYRLTTPQFTETRKMSVAR
jgi:hypothetical protein